MQVERKIDKILDEGYEFEFGRYISEGWKILTSNAGSFIVYTLLMSLITVVTIFIPIVGFLAIIFVLTPAFLAGYYYMAREADQEGYTQLNTGFRGFSELGKLIPLWLLTILISFIAMIPFLLLVGPEMFGFYKMMIQNPSGMVGVTPPSAGFLGTILQYLPSIVSIFFLLSWPFVIFSDMTAIQALKASTKIVSKKWLNFLGLYIVAMLISMSGMIALGVGILFTLAMSSLVMYAAYKNIVGFEEEDGEDELNHLIA